MSGSILRFDESQTFDIEAPCVCHGQPYASIHRKGKRATWLPAAAQVSADSIRPLLSLAVTRTLEGQGKLPPWSQGAGAERILLQRADRWIEEVSAMLREPALGLLALNDVERGAGSLVELAAECAPTLGDALLVFAKQVTLVNEAASFHLHVQGGEAILVMQYRFLLSRTLRDFFAGYMASTVARWLGSASELKLWFYGPRPTHALAYRSALRDVTVGFYTPCDALVLPFSLLRTPMPGADDRLHDFLSRLTERPTHG